MAIAKTKKTTAAKPKTDSDWDLRVEAYHRAQPVSMGDLERVEARLTALEKEMRRIEGRLDDYGRTIRRLGSAVLPIGARR